MTLLMGLIFVSCSEDEEPDICDTANVTYTSDIAAIFNVSCATAGCHVDGNEMNAFFSLEGFEKSRAAAGLGRMIGAINQDDGFTAMPIGGDKLEQCDIDKITEWIAAGTPE